MKGEQKMKRTVKMIIALALALTMICALGTTAFADSNTVVTKNPTDETRYVGETAIFIANAANYDSIEWLFIAPNGTQCKLDAFKTQFPGCTVTGQGTTEMRIANLQTGLNGWKVFCCFGLNGKATTTSAASVNVLVRSAPVTTAPVVCATTPTARRLLKRTTLPTTFCPTVPVSTPSLISKRTTLPITSCPTAPASIPSPITMRISLPTMSWLTAPASTT